MSKDCSEIFKFGIALRLELCPCPSYIYPHFIKCSYFDSKNTNHISQIRSIFLTNHLNLYARFVKIGWKPTHKIEKKLFPSPLIQKNSTAHKLWIKMCIFSILLKTKEPYLLKQYFNNGASLEEKLQKLAKKTRQRSNLG